jgi:nicotinamidase-related amidase
MSADAIPIQQTALLLCDLQNDFIHPDGAYGKAGQGAAAIAAIPARVAPLAQAIRAKGGWIASTHFTLFTGRNGEPFIDPHLKKMRPFLKKGDFVMGSWGHQVVDELAPSDLPVEKVGYDAFYATRLEWILRKVGIRRLIVSGIVTNGGVSSTVRGAHVREFQVTVLEDGCAAFTQELHDTAIAALRPVAEISTVAKELAKLT